MSVLVLSLAYIRQRWLTAGLSVLLLTLGIGTVTFLILIENQLDSSLTRDAAGVDLVVGPKGSPLQLILSTVYQIDVPIGNIRGSALRDVKATRFVGKAVPIALGDSFEGFRIVGTTAAYLDFYATKLQKGKVFDTAMDAVIGSDVARRSGLIIGAEFAASHGIGEVGPKHSTRYTVTGVLAATGTVLDRLILTPLGSIWALHGESEGIPAGAPAGQETDDHHEITAILVRYSSPIGAAIVPQIINRGTDLQGVSPAGELVRLLSLLGFGMDIMRVFGVALVSIAALSTFIALYNALQQRQYDLAILRVLGSSRLRLVMQLTVEALLVSATGVALGLLFGHLIVAAAKVVMPHGGELSISGWVFYPQELWVIALGLGSAVLAVTLPAARVYRINVSRILSYS